VIKLYLYGILFCLLMACGEPPDPESVPAPRAQTTTDFTSDPEPVTEPDPPPNPATEDMLPAEFEAIWRPWRGDFDGMVERRVLRVLTPYGGYQFFYDAGRPRGATYEMLSRLEAYINEQLDRRHVRIYVVPIPVSRDQLIPGLVNGVGDLVATDLTVTPERRELVTFTRPLLTNIREVVVLGPTAPDIGTLDDLAGKEIFVRPTSSYAEHLREVSDNFAARGLAPPVVVPADEILEAEGLLDLLQGGVAGITIMDDYKAEFWASVMSSIDVRNDLVIAEGGSIAWAHRKEDTGLAALLDDFLRQYGKGSAFGNDVYRRYLKRPERVRCAGSPEAYAGILPIVNLLRRFGEEYAIDWLRLAAQGYQEAARPALSASCRSNLPRRQTGMLASMMSPRRKTIFTPAQNTCASSRIDTLATPRLMISIAGCLAWPLIMPGLQRFARRIGRETVAYVSNIYRYFLGYRLSIMRSEVTFERYGEILTFCEQ
jgi:ABC-type amino acid transport substrate-binding protein